MRGRLLRRLFGGPARALLPRRLLLLLLLLTRCLWLLDRRRCGRSLGAALEVDDTVSFLASAAAMTNVRGGKRFGSANERSGCDGLGEAWYGLHAITGYNVQDRMS